MKNHESSAIIEFRESIKKQTKKTKSMKRITVLLFMLTVSHLTAQGISFEHGTFAAALAKAKAEKKLLFMDCYTTWCGPCKMMSKDIFPLKEVGDYMNPNFVSIKVDMEKGEGIELAKTYNVKAFPTLLFIDANGKVVHNMTGASKSEDFIKGAKIAFDPKQQIDYLKQQFDSGNRDLTLVSNYVKALYSAFKREEAVKVGKQVIPSMKPEQYLTEDGFTILAYSGVDYRGKEYNYIVKNKATFIAKSYIGQQDYDYVISNAVNNYLKQTASKAKSIDEVKKAITETHKDFVSPKQDMMDNYILSQYYLANKQYETWFEFNKKSADAAFLKDKKASLTSYINTAYSIAVNPDFANAGLDDKAVAMIENIKDVDPDFIAVNYCLASLYLKKGNKDKALENVNIYIKKSSDKGTEPDARVLALKGKIESL